MGKISTIPPPGSHRWPLRLGLAMALAMALGLLPYRVYGASDERIQQLEGQATALEKSIRALHEENHRFLLEIAALKSDPTAIADIARDELGLVFADELVMRIDEEVVSSSKEELEQQE